MKALPVRMIMATQGRATTVAAVSSKKSSQTGERNADYYHRRNHDRTTTPRIDERSTSVSSLTSDMNNPEYFMRFDVKHQPQSTLAPVLSELAVAGSSSSSSRVVSRQGEERREEEPSSHNNNALTELRISQSTETIEEAMKEEEEERDDVDAVPGKGRDPPASGERTSFQKEQKLQRKEQKKEKEESVLPDSQEPRDVQQPKAQVQSSSTFWWCWNVQQPMESPRAIPQSNKAARPEQDALDYMCEGVEGFVCAHDKDGISVNQNYPDRNSVLAETLIKSQQDSKTDPAANLEAPSKKNKNLDITPSQKKTESTTGALETTSQAIAHTSYHPDMLDAICEGVERRTCAPDSTSSVKSSTRSMAKHNKKDTNSPSPDLLDIVCEGVEQRTCAPSSHDSVAPIQQQQKVVVPTPGPSQEDMLDIVCTGTEQAVCASGHRSGSKSFASRTASTASNSILAPKERQMTGNTQPALQQQEQPQGQTQVSYTPDALDRTFEGIEAFLCSSSSETPVQDIAVTDHSGTNTRPTTLRQRPPAKMRNLAALESREKEHVSFSHIHHVPVDLKNIYIGESSKPSRKKVDPSPMASLADLSQDDSSSRSGQRMASMNIHDATPRASNSKRHDSLFGSDLNKPKDKVSSYRASMSGGQGRARVTRRPKQRSAPLFPKPFEVIDLTNENTRARHVALEAEDLTQALRKHLETRDREIPPRNQALKRSLAKKTQHYY